MVLDIYVQTILFNIGFYIIFFHMVTLKKKWRWAVLPSLMLFSLVDVWIIYAFGNTDIYNSSGIALVKNTWAVLTILLYLLILEDHLWKIAVAIMVSDLLCGVPHFLVALPSEEIPEKLEMFFMPDVPYIPVGIILGTIYFVIEYRLLYKYFQRFQEEPMEKKLWVKILAILYWGSLFIQNVEPVLVSVSRGVPPHIVYGILFIAMSFLIVMLYKDYREKLLMEKYYLRRQNRLIQEHYEAMQEQVKMSERFREEVGEYMEAVEKKAGSVETQRREEMSCLDG